MKCERCGMKFLPMLNRVYGLICLFCWFDLHGTVEDCDEAPPQ